MTFTLGDTNISRNSHIPVYYNEHFKKTHRLLSLTSPECRFGYEDLRYKTLPSVYANLSIFIIPRTYAGHLCMKSSVSYDVFFWQVISYINLELSL